MYSWGDSMDDWARPDAYKFDDARRGAREADARASRARGGRQYGAKSGPDERVTDPRKTIMALTANPLVVAVDVTGSMAGWPAEIFDRLPLLYQTLSQYRPDLEVAFAAIGDAGCDRWPLQVTEFGKGVALEDRLKAIYGEGGGGDAPESYQLFAQFMNTHAKIPAVPEGGEKPFLIVFGDAQFHPKARPEEVERVLGDRIAQPLSGVEIWREVAAKWNVWFLRRPDGGRRGDAVHGQWAAAIGDQKIVYIDDELRGVDYAMGLIARTWGSFGDFERNMLARHEPRKVAALANSVLSRKFEIPDTRTSPPGGGGREKPAA